MALHRISTLDPLRCLRLGEGDGLLIPTEELRRFYLNVPFTCCDCQLVHVHVMDLARVEDERVLRIRVHRLDEATDRLREKAKDNIPEAIADLLESFVDSQNKRK